MFIPKITDGGYAKPLGNGLMKFVGRTHNTGGIGIKLKKGGNYSPANADIEVENNEDAFINGNSLYVLSAQPMINGVSPAQLAENGMDKKQAFNLQEQYKKQHHLNDDGSRNAMFGIRRKAPYGTIGNASTGISNLETLFDNSIRAQDAAQQAVQYASQQSLAQTPQQPSIMQQLAQIPRQNESQGLDLTAYNDAATAERIREQALQEQYTAERQLQEQSVKAIEDRWQQQIDAANARQAYYAKSMNYGESSFKNNYKNYDTIDSFLDSNWDAVDEMYNNLIDCGATHAQAAGICGNIYTESRFDPNAKGDNGLAEGYFQMHEAERTNYAKFCKANGLEQNNKSLAQYVYDAAMKRGVGVGYGDVKRSHFRDSDNPEDTAYGFMAIYERPSTDPDENHVSQRMAAAKQIYNRKMNNLLNDRNFNPNTQDLNIPNTTNNEEVIAKLGTKVNNKRNIASAGLSRKTDYGSSKKPYPSVKSSDFAGGNRSYPIPTRADAIDALRLAGLHGRSDVKAKVYRKYPDLKKELGGTSKRKKFDNAGKETIGTEGDEVNEEKDKITPETIEALSDIERSVNRFQIPDIIGLGATTLAGTIGAVANSAMLHHVQNPPQPESINPSKLKTKYNNEAQRSAIREYTGINTRNILRNTASSQAARNTINQLNLNALSNINQTYADKENMETKLINADIENRDKYREKNISAYNDWRKDNTLRENTVRDLKSQNIIGALTNFDKGINTLITNRQKAVQDWHTMLAVMMANPNVSPEYLAAIMNQKSKSFTTYFGDIFNKDTNKSDK